jgi:serine/threonine-protein phosphatase 2B regulatory subunit
MGNHQSALEEIINETNFTEDEVTRLYKRFVKLDKDGSGSIDTSEFMAIPQIAQNPLAMRLLAVFDSDMSGDIDFKEFLLGLSAFAHNGSEEDKLKCNSCFIKVSFKVYDIDRDGYISNGELYLVLVQPWSYNRK